MFGDVMHGTWLTVFSAWICFADKSDPSSFAGAVAPYRYLLLLMGIFSFYMGLIYNDFSSLPLMLWGRTCYTVEEQNTNDPSKIWLHRADPECVQPFGIDPVWYRSTQEIVFMNSFKMKTSVILGVAQMSLGTCMKGLNSLYFKKPLDFIFEFLTQIFLILVLFGFMDFMIIVKWLTNWDNVPEGKSAPAVIASMIIMFLSGGVRPENNNELDLMDNQTEIMKTMLTIAIICPIMMLYCKPIFLALGNKGVDDDDFEPPMSDCHDLVKGIVTKTSGNHSFSENFIHQIIETIEYSLGTVSNTASYLRLWALSLAHSQLAKVFFDQGIAPGLKSQSYVLVSLTS